MAEEEASPDVQEVTFKWMQIAQAIARGRMSPEDGVARLNALAEAHPKDRDWLTDEADTIRRHFGLDVAESIRAGQGNYWDKLRSLVDALLDERMDHERALELLHLINSDHPEHTEQTSKLINGIADSPLRQILDLKDDGN